MFQTVNAEGNFREVGRTIGEFSRGETANWIAKIKAVVDYDHYLDLVNPYIIISEQQVPNACEMLRGIAEGGNIGYEEAFLLSTRELVDSIDTESAIKNADHCTIAVSFGKSGPIIGHNEDWDLSSQDDLYILNAKINGIGILAMVYRGILPGTSASINSHGLVQCINELDQNNTQIGVPRGLVSLTSLYQKDLQTAENVITNIQKASGFNHVLVSEDEVLNIEIAGSEIAFERVSDKPYIHTNHYTSESMLKFEGSRSVSSSERYSRASQLVHNGMSEIDMMDLLSDRQNATNPISRPDATIGSVVIVPRKREMWINYGPPNGPENYSKITLQ